MSFTSTAFILFAALTILIYYIVPKRVQWVVLLVASLGFYASYDLWFLPFLGLTITSTWLFALIIHKKAKTAEDYLATHKEDMTKDQRKAYKASAKRARQPYLVVGLVLNFAILGVLKYTGFVLGEINSLISLFGGAGSTLQIPKLLLPLGISFYIFRSTAYLIDVYWGKISPQTNIAKYALFVSYFPAVIQGPICRYSQLSDQFFTPHKAQWAHLSEGFLRVLWGFFKKVVIADTAMIAVGSIIANPQGLDGMYSFLLIILYSAVIYGDFTGGIDITIGLARMMGLTLAENFDHPFSSKSTQEYWNRWHITMGSYFNDYIFNPLSVSNGMTKLGKWCKAHMGKKFAMRVPVFLATIITWFLTGLWHGASWNFIVWGLLNGMVILISRELSPLYAKFHKRFPKLKENTFYGAFCCVRTFMLMGSIRILDCYRSVSVTAKSFASIFYDFASWGDLAGGVWLDKLGVNVAQCVVVALSVVVVFFVSRRSKTKPVLTEVASSPWLYSAVCGLLVLSILLLGSYGLGFSAGDFIYTQF